MRDERYVWAVELNDVGGMGWFPTTPTFVTRFEARRKRALYGRRIESRVVKYVPAQEPKRGSKKAGVK